MYVNSNAENIVTLKNDIDGHSILLLTKVDILNATYTI